tara:strand:- start:11546 stop:12550 length:1005 start_codon:yes stop_codon:yes gene_type:complete
MKIEIYKYKDQIAELKEDWDLLFDNGEYSVFQSFVYCFNSLNSDSRPFVICLFNDDGIQEIWPLEFINNKLRFINDTHADFCDILSETDSPLVRECLVAMRQIGKLRLRNLKSGANVIDKINNMSFADFHLSLKFSVLSLFQTDSFPSNFNHFVYRQKRRLKRILTKYSCEHLLCENHSDNFPIKEIADLRSVMILQGKRNKEFLEDNFLLLVESLYNSGLLIVSVIKVQDVVSAISLVFKKDNHYTFWIDLFDEKPMINLYHNTLFLKNITESSEASFNFGRGDYNYKIQNYSPEVFDLFELNTFENYFERLLFKIFRFNKKMMNYCYKKIRR